MNKKHFFTITLLALVILTSIGLALSAYNYYVFDKPFLNDTSKGLISAFVLGVLISIIGLAKSKIK